MGVNNYQTILRIELNDQMCYSEHHLMVPEHFYCGVAGSFKYKYTPFWGNVLKYIPSTFKMYLSTIRSTFQLASNFLYPENQTKFLT